MKKILCLVMAFAIVLSLSTVAFAAETDPVINITNTNTAVSIDGQTYSAYKLYDLTFDGASAYSYTINADFAGFIYTKPDGANIEGGAKLLEYLGGIAENSETLNHFAKAAYKYITDNSIAAKGTATASNEKASIDLKSAGLGYYLVYGGGKRADNPNGADNTVVAACALTTTDYKSDITVKVDVPSLEKKLVDEDGNPVDYITQEVGGKVNFQLKTAVPNTQGYEKYTFILHDTMTSGLRFNAEDLKISINGGAAQTLDEYNANAVVGKATLAAPGADNESFTLSFEPVAMAQAGQGSYRGQSIVVTYTATITAAALTNKTDSNTAELEYSNNPYDDGTGKTSTGDEQTVEVYSFDIAIYKYAENKAKPDDLSVPLADAKFVLYRQGDTDTAYEYYKVTDGVVSWIPVTAEAGKEPTAPDDASPVISSKTEKVKFTGLKEGTYYLQEVAAPDGYNKLAASIPVTISATREADGSFKATVNGVEGTVFTDGEHSDSTNAYVVANIANASGSILPSTGGMGTTIFYIVGALLAVAAVVVLVSKRKVTDGTEE